MIVPHFQTFGLKVLIFTAYAAKTKELQEENRPFGVVGVVEYRNNQFIVLIDTRYLRMVHW
jgi:hypothetical protein